jgi:predicted transcriptional regulator
VTVLEGSSKVLVEVESGEVFGQLMFGINVARVAVQRKAELVLDERQFNAHTWQFGPGDKLTVTERDGMLVVKMTTKGEE